MKIKRKILILAAIIISIYSLIPSVCYAETINVRNATEEDPVICDTDEIYMEFTGRHYIESSRKYMQEIYIENRTDRPIALEGAKFQINDVYVNGYFYVYLDAKCRTYSYVEILDSGVDQISPGDSWNLYIELYIYDREENIVIEEINYSNVYEQDPFQFKDLHPDFKEYEDSYVFSKIFNVRYIPWNKAYEIYQIVYNKTDTVIYAIPHNTNIAGTGFNDSQTIKLFPNSISVVSGFITEDMFYMSLKDESKISMDVSFMYATGFDANNGTEYELLSKYTLDMNYEEFRIAKEMA